VATLCTLLGCCRNAATRFFFLPLVIQIPSEIAVIFAIDQTAYRKNPPSRHGLLDRIAKATCRRGAYSTEQFDLVCWSDLQLTAVGCIPKPSLILQSETARMFKVLFSVVSRIFPSKSRANTLTWQFKDAKEGLHQVGVSDFVKMTPSHSQQTLIDCFEGFFYSWPRWSGHSQKPPKREQKAYP